MTRDQKAIRNAFKLIERENNNPKRISVITKKLRKIADSRGLSERTRMVIQYAVVKWENEFSGYAIRILSEEQERLRGNDN